MRISVLDNDTTQAELICQVLNGAGHSCQAYDSGKDLLGQLRKDSTDLLIVDWQVTDVPAAELLRRAKEKLAPNTPTMFLAGSAAEDDIVAGVTAGADDYLVKPLRRGELVARTQALLSEHGTLVAHVHAEYREALRWLAWLGFDLAPARPLGARGALFHQAILRARS